MTLNEVNTMLTGISGFADKVAYYAFPVGEAPELPFLCYVENGAESFAADNVVYFASKEIDVELYTKLKDPTTEQLVESALTAAGVFWTKTAEYLEDEKCWMITYAIGV